jgi:DNA-binding transcriptional LysR family regulator
MDYKALVGSHLKLRHLVLVLAIAENGSLVRAAEELYLTQPALSRALREAESAVGASLFERTRHGMVPTAAGAACLEHARAVVGQVETLRRRIGELSDPHTGSVGIGAHVTGANLLVPRAVARLVAERPLIAVRIREAPPATLIHELDGGELDLLVGRVTDHPSTARLRLVPLYRESYRIVAAAGHPALQLPDAQLADLAVHPWAIPVAGTPLRDALEKAFASAGLEPPARQVECGTPAPTRTLVVEAGFLAVLPESMAAADPALRMHPLRLGGMAQDVGYMVAPDRPLTASARLLTEHLRTEAALIGGSLSGEDA